jgi:hypothetical protein
LLFLSLIFICNFFLNNQGLYGIIPASFPRVDWPITLAGTEVGEKG